MITPDLDVYRPMSPTCPSVHRRFPSCPGTAHPPRVQCHHEWTQDPWIWAASLLWRVVASSGMVLKVWKAWKALRLLKLWSDEMRCDDVSGKMRKL